MLQDPALGPCCSPLRGRRTPRRRRPKLSPQMSGAIFAPLEGPGALDAASGHPLVCPLCHAQYEKPCLLDCFHHFCAGCLRGRAADSRLSCPLCQHQTVVKGPSGLPPVDRLLQFLVDSSGDGLEVVRCANCDLECSKQAGAPGGRQWVQVTGSRFWQNVSNMSSED